MYLGRQQPPDGESVPLTARVAQPLVEDGVGQHTLPLLPHNLRLHVLPSVDLGGDSSGARYIENRVTTAICNNHSKLKEQTTNPFSNQTLPTSVNILVMMS